MWKELGIALGAPLARAIVGWAQNAMLESSDGGKAITKFELSQLGATVLRVLFITGLIHFGAQGWGVDPTIGGEVAAAVLLDVIVQALKSRPPKKK